MRFNTEIDESTRKKNDQSRLSYRDLSNSCVVLKVQNSEFDWRRAIDINYRDEIFRKAIIKTMHEFNFIITLEIDSNVLTDEKNRESFHRYFTTFHAVDMSLNIYDFINKNFDIQNFISLWICHFKIIKRKNLQIFINSTEDRSKLEISNFWRVFLIIKSIMNTQKKLFFDLSNLKKSELSFAILKNVNTLFSTTIHEHNSQPRLFNSFFDWKLKKMIDSRVNHADRDMILSNSLRNMKISLNRENKK